jgi:hypothetical protein
MSVALHTFRTRARHAAARSALVCVAASLATALCSTAARAGQYHVYSCHTPNGESAPTEGWSKTVAGAGTAAEETCDQPDGALLAAVEGKAARTPNSGGATWEYTAPTNETLVEATLWRAGIADEAPGTEAGYGFSIAGPTESQVFDHCGAWSECSGQGVVGDPFASTNALVDQGSPGGHIYVTASCSGVSGGACPIDPTGYAAAIYVYAANLTLEESAPPTVWDVSGEMASASTLSGTSDVAFDASDAGSGVYEAVVSVDGQVVQSSVIDEDGGRCRNVGETTDGLPAFLYVQPCPPSVRAEVGFETTRVSDGEHELTVSVTDAAGNAATVLERAVTINNPSSPAGEPLGGPNGANASAQARLTVSWKGARGAHAASAYGRSREVVGRLTTASGTPIGGAQVDVLMTPAYAGARTVGDAEAVTDARGDFTVRVPAGASSRTLRFEYSDRFGALPVATATLTLSVRAGVTLRIEPRTTSVGRSIYFSGRLRGDPMPVGGKPLVLEARSPGGAWLEFDVIRANAAGRFHASYRFKFPGPASYEFRVLCEGEADYPYATGASNVVGVFEGGG